MQGLHDKDTSKGKNNGKGEDKGKDNKNNKNKDNKNKEKDKDMRLFGVIWSMKNYWPSEVSSIIRSVSDVQQYHSIVVDQPSPPCLQQIDSLFVHALKCNLFVRLYNYFFVYSCY